MNTTNGMVAPVESGEHRKGRIFLIAVFCLVGILQSGLRDIYNLPPGNDTPNYYFMYFDVDWSSWSDVFHSISFFGQNYNGRDMGYRLFIKATQLISHDFTFFMFITAITFLVPFGMFVFRFVKSYAGIILIFLIYFALFTNIVNSFMRQAVPLGIVLVATKYILSRDWKKYFVLLLIAYTIHGSVLVATPLYFLPLVSTKKKWLNIALIASPVLSIFAVPIFALFIRGTAYAIYSDVETARPINYILLIFFIAIATLVYFGKVKEVENSELLLSGVIGSLFMMPVIILGNTMLRLSYYYVLIMLPLIPIIINSLKVEQSFKDVIYFFLIAVFTLYVLL